MNNKKTMAKGLAFGIVLSNIPTNYIANAIDECKVITKEKVELNNFKENKRKEITKSNSLIKINKNIIKGSVFEITLTDGEYVPDLTGNPGGYETIKVSTTNDKKLVSQDYVNLKNSGIPNIDLSSATSNSISSNAFKDAKHLILFKFPQGVAIIESSAFYGCSGLTGDLVIPNSVTSIGSGAFQNCSGLTGDLVIPNSVTSIGNSVFQNCSGLTGNLVIPNSVTSIGNGVFQNCSGLTGNLVIPNSVTSIGNSVFQNCSGLTGDLVIPNSVKSIRNSAFEGCSSFAGNLIIPNSVISIGSGAFQNCSGLTGDLVIPNSVTSIGSSAFEGCSSFTGNLVIPDSIASIKDYSFYNCKGFNSKLVIPDSVTRIGNSAFYGCSGFTGNLVIPDSVTSIGEWAFSFCNKIEKIFIKINSSDSSTDYKESIISNLPDVPKTIIDVPYNFNVNGTWLETTNKTIGKPIIKNVIDGVENELVDYKGEAVSLYIPSLYKESNITVLKDGKPFALPTKNSDGKYMFTREGIYQVAILTDLGNTSVINFQVEYLQFKHAEEAVNKAENSNDVVDIETARYLVNKLPESTIKDQLQNRIDEISPNLYIESKTATSNVDIYIKSENILMMSLDTNSVTFEDFSGVSDMEKQNAIELTINSSLPYQLNAYLPTEIQNADKTNTMDKSILNIKENSEADYQTFVNTTDRIVLKDNNPSGNDLVHSIDLMLKGGIAHEKDVYKTTIKFEAQQK